ncbi:TAXI family TRAP transporter solute-binding subunit [Falsiroseomonas tokyonensis]|uniref:TAXI family TRAP transporter solute-binding subunit n=1 Tax=Falsiroseomonas tokyonensis TaxID=430521 RepID=A0ABV7C2Q9_9PROT|nr:TAXI family TRAP transporter solute-binding subunit [Falsiroseomonas tokyonensis]MBU8541368.1 TAXI family TRAP transporter solute-binding subunit [Falsiroseomonas tokyonensis]
MWAIIITFLRTWGLIVVLVAAGLAVAYRFVAPPPPQLLRIATGPGPDSAYARATQRYAAALRAEDFTVELVESQGSVENLALLRQGKVDFALVQAGVAVAAPAAAAQGARNSDEVRLVSLGAVFFEPVWVFVRRDSGRQRLQQLNGARIAMGPEGSGTRALALALLEVNAVSPDSYVASPLSGIQAAEALLAGQLDAAVFVAAEPGPAISRLMTATERVELVDFETRAAAYARLLPYVTPVELPRSGFSLALDLPTEDVVLLAPAASLLAKADVHPQLVSLFIRILQAEHRGRQSFAPEGRFPSALNPDVPLHRDAARWYQSGPTFLQSWMPFWVAVTVERMWVLLIPLLTLALPLIRFAPPLYTWQMESRIYRYYDDLRGIEEALPRAADPPARDALLARLNGLEAKLQKLSVPAAYGRQFYALRRDMAWLRERLSPRG